MIGLIHELNQKVFAWINARRQRNEFATDADRLRASQYWGITND